MPEIILLISRVDFATIDSSLEEEVQQKMRENFFILLM